MSTILDTEAQTSSNDVQSNDVQSNDGLEDDSASDLVPPEPPLSLQDIFKKLNVQWAQLHGDTLRMYMEKIEKNVLKKVGMYVQSEKNMSDIAMCFKSEIDAVHAYIMSPTGQMPFTTVENTPELAARVTEIINKKPPPPEPKDTQPKDINRVYTEKEMKSMTVADLKSVCKSYSLTTSGKKDDVIKRILAYNNAAAVAEASVTEVVPDSSMVSESESDLDVVEAEVDADQDDFAEVIEESVNDSDTDL